MKKTDIDRSDNYLSAKKKVEELKGFYIHLSIYVLVNFFISMAKIVRNIYDGETFNEAFFDFGTFAVWIFWGIGIFFHGLGVLGKNIFFSKNWQERKIKEFMDEDKNEFRTTKYE